MGNDRGGVLPPGEDQWIDGEAWGSEERSERHGALAGPTVILMAHNIHGPRYGERGCLAGCWGVGDHTRKRRGRHTVYGLMSLMAHWRVLVTHTEKLGA